MSTQPPPTSSTPWDLCDHCRSPLDEGQRYCVACGARHNASTDPVASYLAATTRQARVVERAPLAPEERPAGRHSLVTAVAIALVPVAAAVGVFVGRGQGGDEQLVEALKAQRPPVINVGAGGGAADGTPTADAGGATKKKKASADADPNDADGEVIAKTRYGTARRLTGAKVTKAQLAESKKALDKIVNSKGKEYVESQRDLPDQIIIP